MRIIVCDDHRLFAEALATVLESAGHEVRTATVPADAVAAVRREPFDIAVMDFYFPAVGTSLEACRAIRESSPDTAVLILTADIPESAVRDGIGCGVAGFSRKDQDVAHLLDAIERIGRGHAVIDPKLLQRAFAPDASPEATLLRFLTPRELEVLERLVHGESTRQIAAAMFITYSTARTHIQSVLTKLGVHSRLEAAAFAVTYGAVAPAAQAGRRSA